MENQNLEQFKAAQSLEVSVLEPTQNTQDGNSETPRISVIDINKPIIINGREYRLDMLKAKWSQMLDWSAEIASGMVIRTWKENGEDISEFNMTKDYASKRNKVITEMIRTLFSLDINVDDINPDTMFEMVEIIQESGFLERLERLNRGSSTTKKNTR